MHRKEKSRKNSSDFRTKILWAQKCAWANFSNWFTIPKTWIVFGVMLIFALWNLSGVIQYSAESGIRCSPWIFPHYFSPPIMWLVYGFLTIALFSDVPFYSAFSDFLKIRTGAHVWIAGQCFFIVEASLFYSLLYFLITIIMISPRIIVMRKWGKLIETFVYNPEAAEKLTGIYFIEEIVKKYSPVRATILAVLFVWLVSCFLGMLILMCRVILGGHVGNAIAGFFVFLSYFAAFVGSLVFGAGIYRFSPVSWINIAVFRGTGGYPDMTYGAFFLIAGILIFGSVGSLCYGRGVWGND